MTVPLEYVGVSAAVVLVQAPKVPNPTTAAVPPTATAVAVILARIVRFPESATCVPTLGV